MAVLIFDIIYAKTAKVMWVKSAAWLVSIGLVIAIIPQLIHLGRVWFGKQRVRTTGMTIHFCAMWWQSSPRSSMRSCTAGTPMR